MSYEKDFDEFMPSSVSWQAYSAHDGYGNPTFGAASSLKCRVEYDMKMTRNSAGDEVVSTCQLYMSGSPGIGVKDRIVLSDGTVFPIVSVKKVNDDKGPHHEEVYIA